MAGVSPFRRTVSDLCRARFPFLLVQTWEEDRVADELAAVAADAALIRTPRKVYVWSLTSGLVEIGRTPGAPDTQAPLKALDRIAAEDEPSLFLLKDFHVFFGGHGLAPDHQVIRRMRDLARTLKESPSPKNVVLVSPLGELPIELQKDVTIVDFALPTEAELGLVLRDIIAANTGSGRIRIELTADDEERLTKAALGLTLHEAENAFARAMVEDGRLNVSDVEVIVEEKRQIIKKTEVLEFVAAGPSFEDVGGLENLKRWLVKRTDGWHGSAERYGLPAPKGILITGVPGCGKSLTAKCTSELWGLPLLRLDVGRIFSGLVGSSEHNMRAALRTAEAISPSILWIDEIEKGFGGVGAASGDSGTSQRVFGTFLTWMQENQKPVIVIATANDIGSLPPEFLRKGRFDEIFFVDLPTRAERILIWRLHLARRLREPDVLGDVVLDDALTANLADLSEGYSGAEIEQAVIAALFDAFSERRAVTVGDFERGVRNMVPLSVTQAEQIRAIRAWAETRAVSATAKEDRSDYVSAAAPAPDPKATDIAGERGGRTVDF
jgi:SpoVK/Ycf46/Vps4 family AAA+-type ATPase